MESENYPGENKSRREISYTSGELVPFISSRANSAACRDLKQKCASPRRTPEMYCCASIHFVVSDPIRWVAMACAETWGVFMQLSINFMTFRDGIGLWVTVAELRACGDKATPRADLFRARLKLDRKLVIQVGQIIIKYSSQKLGHRIPGMLKYVQGKCKIMFR